jgi:MurNAc alpha-1-phosphate uridylyltransferase
MLTAICFAAGIGTRMRPLTLRTPKPLLRLGGVPLLEFHLDALARAGVRRVVVNCHYLAEQILYYAGRARRRYPGIDVVALREPGDAPLETGGGAVRAMPYLEGDAFLAVNADALFLPPREEAELSRLRRRWESLPEGTAAGLLLMQPVGRGVGYRGPGDFSFGKGGVLVPKGTDGAAPYVFSGMQMLGKAAFIGRPAGAWSLSALYRESLAAGRLYGLASRSAWLHIGDPQGFAQAQRRIRGALAF